MKRKRNYSAVQVEDVRLKYCKTIFKPTSGRLMITKKVKGGKSDMVKKIISMLCTVSALLAVSLLPALITGCGGGGTFSADTSTGTIRVGITDKTNPDYEQVVVLVKEIRLVPSGKEGLADEDSALPVLPFNGPLSIDIMQLRFQQEILGTAAIPAGEYTQVRLILEQNPSNNPVNYVVLKSDPLTRIPLKTPSGQQSGVKVLGKFTVQEGVINTIMIDFDPNTAIVDTGSSDKNQKFILKPTGIRIVQTSQSLTTFGSLSGTVSAAQAWTSATVSVKPADSANSIANGLIYAENAGGQALWEAPFTSFVPAGQYRVHVLATGFAPYSSAITSVTTGADSPLGTITLSPAP
jgi:hypothetical protein